MSRPPTPKLNAGHFADIGLFGGLSQETLEVLASSIPASRVEAGDIVVEEGDTSTQMFVVIAGELEVIKKGGDWLTKGARLEPFKGYGFGEKP